MMDHNTVKCDVCKREKQEVNHWLVAIVKPGFEGIVFVPVDSVEEPRRDGYRYEDICGQECAHTRLGRWLDELNNVIFPTKGEAA